MTTNQLAYHQNRLKSQELRETIRANKAREDETERANLAKEKETRRHNVASERLGRTQNVVGAINAGANVLSGAGKFATGASNLFRI